MSGAKIISNTVNSGSVIGFSFSATTRLFAYSSYRVSSGAIDMMLPAPRTTPTPPVAAGSSWASPALRRAVSASTPFRSHTSPENPLSSSLSWGPCGSTGTATRPPGAEVKEMPSSGLRPDSSARSVSASAVVACNRVSGPDIHSSPTSAESSSSCLMVHAARTQSAAKRAVRACRSSRSSRRRRNGVLAHTFSPAASSANALSIAVSSKVVATEQLCACGRGRGEYPVIRARGRGGVPRGRTDIRLRPGGAAN